METFRRLCGRRHCSGVLLQQLQGGPVRKGFSTDESREAHGNDQTDPHHSGDSDHVHTPGEKKCLITHVTLVMHGNSLPSRWFFAVRCVKMEGWAGVLTD